MKDYDPATHAPTEYYKIVYRPDGAKRSKTVIIKEPTVSDQFINGRQVSTDGDNSGSVEVTSVSHVIDVGLISSVTQMALNKNYGWLEDVNPR